MPGGNDHEERPETALDEVVREVARAGKSGERDEDRDASGEAGDAITPNTGAQEQAEGD
ncbi:hypothetical protein [Streptomyces sp. NRRL S-31]|uniref:hypothetical protein n=1 Tax=Streptomyces sp. NRRL S-31 TaxID=1463898 RepID=UPI000A4A817A|nr:hypothetical protein [Streptomyces sp. NRRL S-31]